MSLYFVCTQCGKKTPVTTHAPRCQCGGLFELDFQAPDWNENLLDKTQWNQFRYRAFMALDDDSTWRDITMGEGMTPIIRFNDDVMFKMDYTMPTLSFKDRGAATLIAHCKSVGVKHCVQDSSGNAGNSVAAYCARANIDCEIFVPEGTSPKKITMIESHGAKVHVIEGSRDHCADVCRSQVREKGAYYANHVYNPFFYEGMKTYIYETYEQLGRIPEHIVVPVGNGTLFIGVVKALEHLVRSGAIDHFPKIIALQSELCDPLYQAQKQGLMEPAKINAKPTMAEGIAIGQPMRGEEILDMVHRHKIELITAPEELILKCRHDIAKRGIYCEHTTAANYAAYLHYCELHGPTPDTLITMCGAGIKSDH